MASFFGGSQSSKDNVTGINNIPAPESDEDKNAPPPDAASRIVDFVKVSVCAGECGAVFGRWEVERLGRMGLGQR